MWLASVSRFHSTLSMPTRPSRLLASPSCGLKMLLKMRATATGVTTCEEQHAHPPEGLGAQVLVEDRREDDRDDDLRHRREHEDAERVEDRVPEELVREHVGVIREADPAARTLQQVPLAERDDEGVDEREQPDQAEQDEERGDVGVGARLDVEPAEALARSEGHGASRRSVIERSRGQGAHEPRRGQWPGLAEA